MPSDALGCQLLPITSKGRFHNYLIRASFIKHLFREDSPLQISRFEHAMKNRRGQRIDAASSNTGTLLSLASCESLARFLEVERGRRNSKYLSTHTTLLSCSLPKKQRETKTHTHKKSQSREGKILEVDQREILMWVFRWMAKVPGHVVTQQKMMQPGGLWTLPGS